MAGGDQYPELTYEDETAEDFNPDIFLPMDRWTSHGKVRVATVRFGSGSGTFWPNPNPDFGSGSGCNRTLNLRFRVRTRFGLDLFPFLEISQSETDPQLSEAQLREHQWQCLAKVGLLR
jgi:hypothetical protein